MPAVPCNIGTVQPMSNTGPDDRQGAPVRRIRGWLAIATVVVLVFGTLVTGSLLLLRDSTSVPALNTSSLIAATAVCADQPGEGFDTCMEPRLRSMLDRIGAPASVELIDSLYTDGTYAHFCHRLNHALGSMAYTSIPELSTLMRGAGAGCQGGFFHGVLEQAGRSLAVDEFSRAAVAACEEPAEEIIRVDCQHGIGHGMYLSGQRDLTVVLAGCAKLGKSLNYLCSDGVFMARNVDPDVDHSTIDYASCGVLALDEQRHGCIRNALGGVAKEVIFTAGGFTGLRRICESFARGDRTSCYQSIGYKANDHIVYDETYLNRLLGVCGVVAPSDRNID